MSSPSGPFSPSEIQYLKGLQADSRWQSILGKIGQDSVYRFKPSGDDKQIYKWMYESGRMDAIDNVLALLSGQLEENRRG